MKKTALQELIERLDNRVSEVNILIQASGGAMQDQYSAEGAAFARASDMATELLEKDKEQAIGFGNWMRDNFFVAGSPKLQPYDRNKYEAGGVEDIYEQYFKDTYEQ